VLYLHEQWPGVHSSISVVIYPLILCTLVAVIVWNAWTTRGDQRAYTEIR
jgi:DMSO/TMAO reductase YedYZ heme-binding membrane subunit